jgi:hypothetical protein
MLRKLIALFLSLFQAASAAATRESILGASDRIAGYLDIPEWGGRVYLATLTVAQRAKFLEALSRLRAGNDSVEQAMNYYQAQVGLLADAVVGQDSVALFTGADVERLATKSPALVGRVYDEIVRLNGFSVVATEEKAKN